MNNLKSIERTNETPIYLRVWNPVKRGYIVKNIFKVCVVDTGNYIDIIDFKYPGLHEKPLNFGQLKEILGDKDIAICGNKDVVYNIFEEYIELEGNRVHEKD